VSTGEMQWFLRPTVTPATDPLSLDYPTLLAGGTQVGYHLDTSAGHDALVIAQLQSGVQRQERTTVALGSGWLLRTLVQNDTDTFTSAVDAQEHVVWHQGPSGSTTRFFYDALRRLREVDLADGTAHRVGFDDHGRVSTVARDGIASVRASYDASGHLASKTYLTPAGVAARSVSYAYDGAGRTTVETHTDSSTGASQRFQYFYDGATPGNPLLGVDRGLLTAVAGDGYTKLFTYRPDGSLSTRSVSLGGWRTVDTELSYFEDGSVRESVVTVRGPEGAVLSTSDKVDEVDANGRLTQTLLGGLPLASYAYDGNGLPSSISFATGETVGFRYDQVTRRQVGMDQAGPAWTASTTTQLNNRGFLDQESMAIGATSLVRAHGYTPEGYLASATDASNSYGYGYDANGLISRIDTAGVSMPLLRSGSTLQAGAVTYQFDGLGRVVQAGDLTLSYGPDGYLSSATRGTGTWTFLCDEKGMRLAKLSGGAFVAAYLAEGVLDASGLTQPVQAGGALVGVIANGKFQLVAADTRGTVLADKNGTPHIASPYGDRAQHPDVASVVDYVQQRYDADLGVVRMGVRDYDPHIHRFLTPDPLYLEDPVQCLESPVDCNLYGYARNVPGTYGDPTGRNPAILGGAAIGAAFSTAMYMIETPVEEWTLKDAGAAALGGAINGAIAGATGGASLLTQIGGGAIASAAGGIVTRAIKTGSVEKAFDPDHLASDLTIGALLSSAAAVHGSFKASIASAGEEAIATSGSREAQVVAQSDPFAAHAAMREDFGLAKGEGTLARLEAGGKQFWGINAHGQSVAPLRVNAISATHAEADAFAQAARAGVKGGEARLVVDRELCPACGTFGAVRSMARQLGIDALEVVSPLGTSTIDVH
jgi:RHS repeat-associated protein